MNFIKKSIYALSLVGMTGLWSCSQDGMLPGDGDVAVKGQPVKLTLTVNRGGAQTRTTLTEDAVTGRLVSDWAEDDFLYVYDTAGKQVGKLQLESGKSTPVGVFSGEIVAEEGTHQYNFWYFNLKEDRVFFTSDEQADRITVNISEQNFKSAGELAAMEILSSKDPNEYDDVLVTVRDGMATVAKDVVLQSRLAMAHFSFTGLPNEAGTLEIYDVNNKIYIEESYHLGDTNRGRGLQDENGTGIKVNMSAGQTDVYVTLIPYYIENTLGFKFTATESGKEYTFKYTNPTKVEAGVYYCGADGKGQVIEMEEVTPETPVTPEPQIDEEVVGPAFQIINRTGDKVWVKFTRANLHYRVTDGTWFIPENQTDFVRAWGTGIGYENPTMTGVEVIDLFRWGATGYQDAKRFVASPIMKYKASYQNTGAWFPYKTEGYETSNTNTDMRTVTDKYVDWGWAYGYQLNGNDLEFEDKYFTLTGAEWKELIGNYIHFTATVAGVPGIVMLPCKTDGEAKSLLKTHTGLRDVDLENYVRLTESLNSTAKTKLKWTNVIISDYDALAKMNAVFLPAVGNYYADNSSATKDQIYYWEATKCTSTNASNLWLRTYVNSTSADFKPVNSTGKNMAMSVRLVKVVEGPDDETVGDEF